MRPLVWLLAGHRRWCARGGVARDGPVLVIANHVTAFDGALVLYALPGRLRRRVATAMSGEMLLDLREGGIRATGCSICWRLWGIGC